MSISSLMLNFDDLNTLVFTENIFKDIKNEVETQSTCSSNSKEYDADDYGCYDDDDEKCLYPPVSQPKLKSENKLASCERKVELKVKRNARERRRVQQLADGFRKLRNVVPVRDRKKLSKLETLRVALEYISDLRSTLEYLDSNNQSSTLQVVPQCAPPTPSWSVPLNHQIPPTYRHGERVNNYPSANNMNFQHQLDTMGSFFSY